MLEADLGGRRLARAPEAGARSPPLGTAGSVEPARATRLTVIGEKESRGVSSSANGDDLGTAGWVGG